MRSKIHESLENVSTCDLMENRRNILDKLFLNKIRSFNCVEKYIDINKNRLYVKVKNRKLLL